MQVLGRPFGYIVVCTLAGAAIGRCFAEVRPPKVGSRSEEKWGAYIATADRAAVLVPIGALVGGLVGYPVERVIRRLAPGWPLIGVSLLWLVLLLAQLWMST